MGDLVAHSVTRSLYVTLGCFCATAAELDSFSRLGNQQNLKYLLSDPLQVCLQLTQWKVIVSTSNFQTLGLLPSSHLPVTLSFFSSFYENLATTL